MIKIRLVLLLLLTSIVSLAQKSTDTVALLHSYTPNKGMQLKWLPRSQPAFWAGMAKGYNIYRATVNVQNGTEKLSAFEKLNTAPIVCYTDDQIKAAYKVDTSMKLAAFMVSSMRGIQSQPAQTNVSSAIQEAKTKELMSLFGSFAAISSNKTAEALGFYWLDKTAQAQAKYVYRLEIIDHPEFTSYLITMPFVNAKKEKIMALTAKVEHGAITISWFNNGNRSYPYFNVYRSNSKSGGFVKLNRLPYVGDRGELKDDKRRTSFCDSIKEYQKKYYYKVVGINAFEEEGTPSDVKEVYAAYILQNAPIFVSIDSKDNKNIQLVWSIDPKEARFVKGFTLKRASSSDGRYGLIHKNLLPSSQLSFTDKTPGSSNYYIVCAFGETGDSVCSTMMSKLLVDSIPPAKPEILSGICDTNGIVTLKWKKGLESDLYGYRIFRSDAPKNIPLRITPEHVTDTVYTDTVVLKRQGNRLYYRITALDKHYNPSIPSDYFMVILPDKNPPLNGYFTDYKVEKKGIRLEWQASNAPDLKSMHLMRKSAYDFSPINVFRVSGDSIAQIRAYMDTTTKSNVDYDYTLVAEDSAGLRSEPSKALSCRQIFKEQIPAVTNLKATVGRENKMVKLSWDFAPNAESFKIFRAEGNKQLATYEFVAGNTREFYDKWLKPNSIYRYVVVAMLPGGYTSGFSATLEVNY